MKRFPARRLTTAIVLTATITLFTLPAAAAPAGTWTFGSWQLPTFLTWFDTLWTGWLGAPTETDGASGIGSVFAGLDSQLEPDGVRANTAIRNGGSDSFVESFPSGGF